MPTTAPPRDRTSRPIDPRLARRTRRALTSTVVGLAVFDVARAHVIDAAAGVATNLLMAAALAGVCGYATLTAAELGTERDRLRSGARYGGVAAVVVAAVVGAAALLSGGSGAMADERLAVGPAAMALHVLVVIPLGTVVLEELAFRGLLLGLARRVTTTGRAVLVTSVLFGLWHVPPAIASIDDAGALRAVTATPAGVAATVAGTVVTTFVAGLAFSWLRLRSRSLLAPALAHVATNSITFAVAWLVAR